ncbi:MAG TPA: S8 family serine peptidase [Solirubrobacteraceae bacterium]
MQLIPAGATAANQQASRRVIVLLKNQETGLPATKRDFGRRRAAIQRLQAPIRSQLSASGANSVKAFTVVNAVSATVSQNEASQLKSNPAVREVVPDQAIRAGAPTPPGAQATSGPPTAPLPGACAAPGKVELDPQALQTIRADSDNPTFKTARALGIDGSGVKVAFIADGLDINNPDFIRPNGQHVFFDFKDFGGDGTAVPTGGGEAFLDASSIAAQGRKVYDVSHYSDLPLNSSCKIRVEGVAPGASLAGLDIFGAEDTGFNSSFLQAIDYAVGVDHVQVLNESLGMNLYPDDAPSLDLIKQANDNATAAGTTVTVSTGDAGVTGTLSSPGTAPHVISMGATTTYRLLAQVGYGGARFPGVSGWLNNNISSFSSAGFAQDASTLDAVAPGELNWALCSTNTNMFFDCVNYAGKPTPVQATGGTSESAPLAAGTAALVIQAYRKTHQGNSPSPAVVKQIIDSTTDDIAAPAEQQGAGLIDAFKAVQAAESYQAPSSRTGSTLLKSATQLTATGPSASSQTLTDTLTNNGAQSHTYDLSSRTLGAYTQLTRSTVQLSDANSPKQRDWQGIMDNVETVKFSVPGGQDRLETSIAFQNASPTSLNARVRMTLVDPNGNLADYSVPQGDGNFGHSEVADPAPGQWTAFIYSRNSQAGGTEGPVVFGASVARYHQFGTVTPSSVTLAPGQSATATLQVTTPAQPSDQAGSMLIHQRGAGSGQVNQGAGHDGSLDDSTTTVPVTLRSLIPAGHASFSGVLTGGNGRDPFTGQANYYQIDVPSGAPELNATVRLNNDADNPFTALLVSPTGEAQSVSSNSLPAANNSLVNVQGAQLHTLSPAAGRWTLIIAFVPRDSGTRLSEPFTVTMDQDARIARANGLPDSPSTTLAAGKPDTFPVTIQNTGNAPEAFFVDARSPGSTQITVPTLTTATAPEPFTAADTPPLYLVPTHTTLIKEQASTSGAQPIQFDSNPGIGDPDIASSAGKTATASFADNPVTPGQWGILPVEVGPFGATPGPKETATTSMSVVTQPFDPAVTASSGDLWLASENTKSLASFAPVQVNPGQVATINVTITPSAPSGTKVTGTLFVDDFSAIAPAAFNNPFGNDVAALPYSYTVK